MKKFISAALLTLGAAFMPAHAQEEEQPATYALPYVVEMNKPIRFEITLTNEQGNARMIAKESGELTPQRAEGDTVFYRYTVTDAELVSVEGMPPMLDDVLKKMGEAAKGMAYEYAADDTGYPIQLTEAEQVRSFMGNVVQGFLAWAAEWGANQGFAEPQIQQFQAMMQQGLADYTSSDNEGLSRLVLDQGQQIFYATGRELYVDYLTEFNSSRYFELGEFSFQTVDSWELVSIDEAAGTAQLRFEQTLNDEEFQGFLSRVPPVLQEQGMAQAQIDAIVAAYKEIVFTRSGDYTMDTKTGLPLTGTIRTETAFGGEREVETVAFTSSY